MMSKSKVHQPAPAKVNLALEVLGLLPGGYHELDTVFAWLDWCDDVQVSLGTGLDVVSEVDGGLSLGPAEENLAVRALRALDVDLHVRLVKRIPAGAGLGGGSADAAAVLVAANELLGLGRSREELERVGAQLGADVAFGVQGGAARGRGRGDELSPLPPPPECEVVVVQPPFGLATGPVYRAWDATMPRVAPGAAERMADALRLGSYRALVDALANDLEPAACSLEPSLTELIVRMREAGCDGVLLSGSGSCVFGLVSSEAARVAARLEPLGRVVTTRFRGPRNAVANRVIQGHGSR